MNAENTSWKALHHQSTIVDLHTHPSLKATVFHRNLGRKKRLSHLLDPFTSVPKTGTKNKKIKDIKKR